jgi:hypothetical protein
LKYFQGTDTQPDKSQAAYLPGGFVLKPEEWKYNSTMDYYGSKGLLEIIKWDTLIV